MRFHCFSGFVTLCSVDLIHTITVVPIPAVFSTAVAFHSYFKKKNFFLHFKKILGSLVIQIPLVTLKKNPGGGIAEQLNY